MNTEDIIAGFLSEEEETEEYKTYANTLFQDAIRVTMQINNAYPIWHGQAPRIIDTFMESYDFDGKTIVPFCTSHSSGIGGSDTYLHGLVSEDVNWKAGRRFEGGTSKDTIMEWLDELGIQPYVNDTSLYATGGAAEVGKFDFENKSVLLNSGYYMPINGIGTYSLLDDKGGYAFGRLLPDW